MKRIFILVLLLFVSLSFGSSKKDTNKSKDINKSKDTNKSNDKKEQCREKKYCKDMKSCKEAIFHLEVCGNKKLDKDRDGIPCENICR